MDYNSRSYKLLLTIGTFIVLEVISIVMIAQNSILQRYLILDGIRSTQVFFWERSQGIRDFFNLRAYNQALQEENAELRGKLAQVQYLQDFKAVTDSTPGLYKWIPASIIKSNPNKQHNYLILNRGAKDGVETEMGVVTHNSIVGVVGAVSENYCYVISFLNKSQRASAMISGTSDFGLLTWNGTDSHSATLSHIPLSSTAAVGDTVCTSGYSTIYPPDIPVGVISDINAVSGMYKDMGVDLFQDLRSLKYVYIVQRHHQGEIDELSTNASNLK
ncbi:MAG: rod shape-determining protein MreC [Bacteroidales bacterium]|jgi:rod shape-determining protein MreC|nr:rod shape-determining protein MreC [Bacteroidales bacterium]MBQ5401676.1 rod shape-determining protein MreC [Bacteroidales bacterium]